MKPVIGITGHYTREELFDAVKVDRHYVEAVKSAGGIPLVIPVLEESYLAKDVLGRMDGLLLTGGPDVLPMLFDENPHVRIGSIDAGRDKWEIALFMKAYEMDMPILGICRGIQIMNVALGGTLYQDIPSQLKLAHAHFAKDAPMDTLFHGIKIEPGLKLHEILGKSGIMVNSCHHQALKMVAKEFAIGAVANDGVIEAIEASGKNFVAGVQWHPEALCRIHEEHAKIFEAFLEAARKKRKEGI